MTHPPLINDVTNTRVYIYSGNTHEKNLFKVLYWCRLASVLC